MGKEMRDRRNGKMTLGVVLTGGWRRRSPKPTSHHPGPQPPLEQPPPPWAPGAEAGALSTLGGLQEAGESKTTQMRHGNVIAGPSEQRPWQELCCEPSAPSPCCRHPGTPGQCRRSHVLHLLPTKGFNPFQPGETSAFPALLWLSDLGHLCYLQMLHRGPQDLK